MQIQSRLKSDLYRHTLAYIENMYIVDKHKDYYDYISHVYGVDKGTTFDRRGSCELSFNELIRKVLDAKRYYYDNRRFILETGFTQYLFAITDVKRKPVNNPSAMWCRAHAELAVLEQSI